MGQPQLYGVPTLSIRYTQLKIGFPVLALYILLTFLMVYLPAGIKDFNNFYLGHNECVFWSNYFWWTDYALEKGLNPLFDSYIFYPFGLRMSDGLLPMFLSIPLTRAFGAVASYNLYLLSTFAIAGYGAFLLVRHLIHNFSISVFAGVIFAFFPFHFGAALGHLHTFSILWIPFYLLFYIKLYEEPSSSNVFLAALFFACNALTSWTIAIMLSIFSIAYALLYWRQTFSKKFITKFFIFCLLSLFLIAPGLYLMLLEVLSNKHMVKPFDDFIFYSADLLAFFTPAPYHPILGKLTKPLAENFTGNFSENLMFVGYTVIFLASLGVIFERQDKHVRTFTILTVFFGFLTLGPFLHLNGIYKFTKFDFKLMLPGILLNKLPFINMIRVPSRYHIMVMIGLTILSGYGLSWVFKKTFRAGSARKYLQIAATLFFSTLLLFEYLFVMPVQKVEKSPETYYAIRKHPDQNPLIDLPMNLLGAGIEQRGITGTTDTSLMTHYYEYQKIHQKPFFGGYWSRIEPDYQKFLQSDAVVKFLVDGTHDIINLQGTRPLPYLQYNYQLSHVILHENFMAKDLHLKVVQFLGENYTRDCSSENDPLIVFSTSPMESKDHSVSDNIVIGLGRGWHGRELWSLVPEIPCRWMMESAQLSLKTKTTTTAQLNLSALSFQKNRKLEIKVNDVSLGIQEISASKFVNVKLALRLEPGVNHITLHSCDGAGRPCDTDAHSTDERPLSFAVQNIYLTPVD